MLAAPEFTLLGLQASAVTSMGATRVKLVDWEDAFKVAVTVALWVVVRVLAVAVKVLEVVLAATVAEAGTASNGLLFDSATLLPPVGVA